MSLQNKRNLSDKDKWEVIIQEHADLKKENAALKEALEKVAAGYLCETCQRLDCPDRPHGLKFEISSCTSFRFDPK